MEFIYGGGIVLGLVVWFVLVYYATKMATARGRSPVTWGVITGNSVIVPPYAASLSISGKAPAVMRTGPPRLMPASRSVRPIRLTRRRAEPS